MQRPWVSWITLALVLMVVLAPPTAAQASISRLELSSPSVAPGGEVQVSSDGCLPGAGTVIVALLDADSERELVTTTIASSNGERWTATISVPSTVRPGSYPVAARCLDDGAYSGDDGDYSGGDYDGGDDGDGAEVDAPGAGHTFETAYLQVLPPPTAPDADGHLELSPDTVAAGGTTVVSGTGWNPGEQVTVAMYSAPVVLAHVRADPTGSIAQRVTVPAATTPGQHRVVAMNATSASHTPRTLDAVLTVGDRADVTVPTSAPSVTPAPQVAGVTQEPGSLAFTGGSVVVAVLVGLGLLAAGLVARARR